MSCLSCPFLRDADSRKGTLCPFCVPIHKKKKKKVARENLDGKLAYSKMPSLDKFSNSLLGHISPTCLLEVSHVL